MWDDIVAQFSIITDPSPQLLARFLVGLMKRDSILAHILLDEAVDHPVLAKWFPIFQAAVHIDDRGLKRLHQSLKLKLSPITNYTYLAYGTALDHLSWTRVP